MRTSSIYGASLAALGAAVCAIAVSGCGGSSGDDTTTFVMGGTSGASSTAGSASTTGGVTTLPMGGTGTMTGGTGTMTGGTGTMTGGSDTGGSPAGGTTAGGAPTGGSGGSGGGSQTATGHFKMLAYCETRGFHHDSIENGGLQMLKDFGAANDFEVAVSDGEQPDDPKDPNYAHRLEDPQITKAALAPFDMVFFMNPTGDIFTNDEQTIFMEWLHEKKAFAGVHSTTDTESSWPDYEELVGEIYTNHSSNGTPSGTVSLEAAQLTHPSLVGIATPWTRNEEWYKFGKGRVTGGTLPGFVPLIRYTSPPPPDDHGATVGQPVSWYRNWQGIRSFYTAMGHDKTAYNEPAFKKHVLGGILWAVRRLDPGP